MHIEYIPQMLIVWVNEFIYWKVSLTAHKRYFYIDFFVFNLWCLQQLTKGLLASECTCLLHCCQGDLLKRKSEHAGLLQVARGREAGVETLRWRLPSPVRIRSLYFLISANSAAFPYIHVSFQASWKYMNFPKVPVPWWPSAFTPVLLSAWRALSEPVLPSRRAQVPFPVENLCIPSSS